MWSCCGACKEHSDCSRPVTHPTHWNHPLSGSTHSGQWVNHRPLSGLSSPFQPRPDFYSGRRFARRGAPVADFQKASEFRAPVSLQPAGIFVERPARRLHELRHAPALALFGRARRLAPDIGDRSAVHRRALARTGGGAASRGRGSPWRRSISRSRFYNKSVRWQSPGDLRNRAGKKRRRLLSGAIRPRIGPRRRRPTARCSPAKYVTGAS